VLKPTTTQAPGTEDRDYCILIIDDEPMNVKLLETVLKNVDSLQTVSTSRSTEAVDLYKATSPDLVMLDLHMPQMDGFEVMSAIRRLIPSERRRRRLPSQTARSDRSRTPSTQLASHEVSSSPRPARAR
jgi:CheY-like chemotaxis protein